MNYCYIEEWHYYHLLIWPSDDIIEAVGFKSGSSTPQRSGSTAGLHRPRLSIDSASPAIDLPQLSSSLPGSLSGSSPLLTPRQGSHTMDFFEMCASLITTLARWDLSSPKPRWNLDVGFLGQLLIWGVGNVDVWSDFLFLSPLSVYSSCIAVEGWMEMWKAMPVTLD